MLTKLFVVAVMLMVTASGASALDGCNVASTVHQYCMETTSEQSNDSQTFALAVAQNGNICIVNPLGIGSVSLNNNTYTILSQTSTVYVAGSAGLNNDLVQVKAPLTQNSFNFLQTTPNAVTNKLDFDVNLVIQSTSSCGLTLALGATVARIQLSGKGNADGRHFCLQHQHRGHYCHKDRRSNSSSCRPQHPRCHGQQYQRCQLQRRCSGR